ADAAPPQICFGVAADAAPTQTG
ncbi:hypothetical protein A2U01_0111033, partial [Trifolium medium]|nr:hypothetical protein [Trifolium medium]